MSKPAPPGGDEAPPAPPPASKPPALDPNHPLVFRQRFVRFAGRVQWLLLGLGALTAVVGCVLWAAGAAGPAVPLAGAGAWVAGIVWARLWRRSRQRAWWGEKYGEWF